MIKILTACTYELDDSEKAAQEILSQIDPQNSLLKNSAAMLFCHIKFIEMGVMEKICKNLPFDVVGCTSLYFAASNSAVEPKEGEIMLTVTVLTSDDMEFAAGICDPLTPENAEGNINALYQKTASALSGPPALVFAFPPTLFHLTIDIMTAALDKACGGLPVFGTVALDIGAHIRSPKTIYQGTAYADCMALLLFKGPVKPHFVFRRFPEGASLAQDAVITRANGAEIISINNEPAASFLQEIGLIQSVFSQAIPLVIADSDGNNQEVVVVQKITDEGTLICGRHIPVGGILDIGAITADYVLESAKALIREVKKDEDKTRFTIIISCFLRTIVLGHATAEVSLIQQELGDTPGGYLYLNSGGELCPRYIRSGETVNQALQYAVIACQF
jgi:hypothetical protein